MLFVPSPVPPPSSLTAPMLLIQQFTAMSENSGILLLIYVEASAEIMQFFKGTAVGKLTPMTKVDVWADKSNPKLHL
jgi:hypothetical protein